MKRKEKTLAVLLLLLPFLLTEGCATTRANRIGQEPALSIINPGTQACLDSIPEARYKFRARDDKGKEMEMEFTWPWYVAIADVRNETGSYETAAAGQVNYSTTLGMATRKYYLFSALRGGLKVAFRDPEQWNEIRKTLMEVGGEGSILNRLTPLDPNTIKTHVLGRLIPPELFISGALAEVTIAEESSAAGLSFAGVGGSGKTVYTSVSGSIEVTDPYTGEMLVSVMGQNRVKAEQVGFEMFRVVSVFGVENKYLNVELAAAREIIKQQVQSELVDYLFAEAFKKLREERPEILVERFHYRVGRIAKYAERLARERGLTPVEKSLVPAGVELPREEVSVRAIEEESTATTRAAAKAGTEEEAPQDDAIREEAGARKAGTEEEAPQDDAIREEADAQVAEAGTGSEGAPRPEAGKGKAKRADIMASANAPASRRNVRWNLR